MYVVVMFVRRECRIVVFGEGDEKFLRGWPWGGWGGLWAGRREGVLGGGVEVSYVCAQCESR